MAGAQRDVRAARARRRRRCWRRRGSAGTCRARSRGRRGSRGPRGWWGSRRAGGWRWTGVRAWRRGSTGSQAALRAERDQRADLRAQLAGPRSTAVMLAGLPVLGLLLGSALGADPLHVLLHTGAGLGCLLVGGVLEGAGLWWALRIVRGAEAAMSTEVVHRLGVVLCAVALALGWLRASARWRHGASERARSGGWTALLARWTERRPRGGGFDGAGTSCGRWRPSAGGGRAPAGCWSGGLAGVAGGAARRRSGCGGGGGGARAAAGGRRTTEAQARPATAAGRRSAGRLHRGRGRSRAGGAGGGRGRWAARSGSGWRGARRRCGSAANRVRRGGRLASLPGAGALARLLERAGIRASRRPSRSRGSPRSPAPSGAARRPRGRAGRPCWSPRRWGCASCPRSSRSECCRW